MAGVARGRITAECGHARKDLRENDPVSGNSFRLGFASRFFVFAAIYLKARLKRTFENPEPQVINPKPACFSAAIYLRRVSNVENCVLTTDMNVGPPS
jgi:hypothetical protein